MIQQLSTISGRLSKRDDAGNHVAVGEEEDFIRLDGKLYRVDAIKSLPEIPEMLLNATSEESVDYAWLESQVRKSTQRVNDVYNRIR